MRFHVVGLPHTQTTLEYSACAFTAKVRGFCKMMKERGHTVILYAGEKNDAPCDELVTCISEKDRAAHVGKDHYTQASFDYSLPIWLKFNDNVIRGVQARAEQKDFICVIGGRAHQQIANALPNMLTVEFGIGYGGTFAKYRVFESYAWMHTIYGAASSGNANAADGHWFDAVIPGYLDPKEFPYRGKNRRGNDYYLFIGRLIDRKGFQIAADVCERSAKRLVVAGQGVPPRYGEYVGVVGPEERNRLMAGATAMLVPTQYIEPFGNVAIEAQACGTPVITTDWGAFTETVVQGVTGYRCRTFSEFTKALEDVKKLDPRAIRRHVVQNYSLDAIGQQYEDYFTRLSTLWGDGWYSAAA